MADMKKNYDDLTIINLYNVWLTFEFFDSHSTLIHHGKN